MDVIISQSILYTIAGFLIFPNLNITLMLAATCAKLIISTIAGEPCPTTLDFIRIHCKLKFGRGTSYEFVSNQQPIGSPVLRFEYPKSASNKTPSAS